MRILGIEKACFSEDFSFFQVEVRTDQNQLLALEMATDLLKEGLVRLWDALRAAGMDDLIEDNKMGDNA